MITKFATVYPGHVDLPDMPCLPRRQTRRDLPDPVFPWASAGPRLLAQELLPSCGQRGAPELSEMKGEKSAKAGRR